MAAWVCRVCEALSVSFGLVLFRALMHWLVNAWVIWNSSDVIGVFLALCVKTCVMWNVSDVAGVFLALSLSLALPVHLFVVSLVCLLIVCTVTG